MVLLILLASCIFLSSSMFRLPKKRVSRIDSLRFPLMRMFDAYSLPVRRTSQKAGN
ncbi:hypothetical protein BH10PLA1_BH10PLA1_01550 [soil metagenome]